MLTLLSEERSGVRQPIVLLNVAPQVGSLHICPCMRSTLAQRYNMIERYHSGMPVPECGVDRLETYLTDPSIPIEDLLRLEYLCLRPFPPSTSPLVSALLSIIELLTVLLSMLRSLDMSLSLMLLSPRLSNTRVSLIPIFEGSWMSGTPLGMISITGFLTERTRHFSSLAMRLISSVGTTTLILCRSPGRLPFSHNPIIAPHMTVPRPHRSGQLHRRGPPPSSGLR
jgi:hypothetical protein